MSWTTSAGTGKFITEEERVEMWNACEKAFDHPSEDTFRKQKSVISELIQKYNMPKGTSIGMETGEFYREIIVPDAVCDAFYNCSTMN